VYFISEVLSESKIRYLTIQKLLYAILITSRKLSTTLMSTRSQLSLTSHWRIYSTIGMPPDAYPRKNQIPAPVNRPEHWIMYFDGSLKLEGGGAGVLFISPRGEQLKYVLPCFAHA
jgi:hypothetical protein